MAKDGSITQEEIDRLLGGEDSPKTNTKKTEAQEKAKKNIAKRQAESKSKEKAKQKAKETAKNPGILKGINVSITAVLGETQMDLESLQSLGEGQIVELNKLVGEPVDLYANTKLVARGEVVCIDENFAVRVTEIAGE